MARTRKTAKTTPKARVGAKGRAKSTPKAKPRPKPAARARRPQADLSEGAPQPSVIIVGIGSSAGGLEALTDLIAGLPQKTGLTYVVAQHLSPKHPSLMKELLARGTHLQVLEIVDGVEPQPNTIYITPPGHDVEVADGLLRCYSRMGVGPKPSVDMLFTSLASSMGENSVAVVLSGTGSDGASGVRSVRAAGGVVLVQEPTQAKYDGMPSAAVKTGSVDNILPAREIGQVLAKLAPVITGEAPIEDEAPPTTAQIYDRIVAATKKRLKFNLGHYKETTLYRRIARRMQVNRASTLEDYAELLESNVEEPERLSRDLLISVTSFFRDPEHFEVLKIQLGRLIDSREADDILRIWVTPCATGQEAYSLAMVLWELMSNRRERPEFKIFASDIDTDALSVARSGTYSESGMVGLDPEMRRKYFERQESNWVARKFLRDGMVFAEQNLIEDPPFSRMDLISCRNLLIYLRPEAQKRALELIHYALKSDGIVFMGKTETADLHTNLLEPVSQDARIYRRARGSKSIPVSAANLSTRRQPDSAAPSTRDPVDVEIRSARSTRPWELTRALVSRYCPPTVFVDAKNQVVHTAGDLGAFVQLPDGDVQLDVLQMINPVFRTEARALLERTRRERTQLHGSRISLGDAKDDFRLALQPMVTGEETLIMLSFEPGGRPSGAKARGAKTARRTVQQQELITELERELEGMRVQLQHVVEQLETANEELQAQSEELQSSNEELQSTNEELQTSNEELQSTNEELSTVNDELNSKTENLDQVASIFVSVKDGLGSPLIVVDRTLHVTDCNQEAKLLVSEGQVLLAHPISGLGWRFDINTALEQVRGTLKDGKTRSTRIHVGTRHYLLTITQNRSSSGVVRGVSLIFIDISEQVRAEASALDAAAALADERDRIAVTLQSIGDGVITTDQRGHVAYMNPMASEITGWTEPEAIGQPINEVYRTVSGPEAAGNPVLACLRSGKTVLTRQVNPVIVGRSGRRIQVMESAAPLRRPNKETYGAVLVFRDVSDERLLNQELQFRANHDPLTGMINRYEFDRMLRKAHQTTRERKDLQHVLLYIDLDNFKLVNDTAGHDAGDALLKAMAGAIRGHIRGRDVAGRIGGDEFGVLLYQCNLDHARNAAEKIRVAVSEAADRVGVGVDIGASVGLVQIDSDSGDVADIISAADAACYAAKESGKNQIYVATASDDWLRAQHQQAKVVPLLQSALRNGRLSLGYEDVLPVAQPNQPVRYRELLVRMTGKGGESYQPEHFLPAAERYQLIVPLDLTVLGLAVEAIEVHLGEHPTDECTWAVNASGVSLSDREYRDGVNKLLKAHPNVAARLCLEITESTAIRQMSDVVPFANNLREQGCSIALDDFGAGMSGFNYLKMLPVNYLKIDGSLIRDLPTDEVCQSMVRAIIDVAAGMGIPTIAEHVENKAILKAVRDAGIEMAQGRAVGAQGTMPVPGAAAAPRRRAKRRKKAS